MIYDLNIAWSPSTPQDQLLQTLHLAATLGYGTVALNHTLPASQAGSPTSPFLKLPESSVKLPAVLHRATYPLADPAASTLRLQVLTRVYDIIAIRPTTALAFQNACLTLEIPIISLDMTQHMHFHFKPKPCMAAVSRGVRFEICYGQALGADQRGRATFIGNVTGLIRATRGRGIISSSEAKSALGLRAPADVVNLMSVWGLGNEKGMEGLGAIPRSVVVNEGIKRRGYRGVIDIVQVAERDGNEPKREQVEKRAKNQKQKRKTEGEDGQSKKMRVVPREADEGDK